MSLEGALAWLRRNPDFMADVVAWERIPPRPARLAPFPEWLDPRLAAGLRAGGIGRLYAHQAAAMAAAYEGRPVVVATATASGKSLCYTLPVVQRLLAEPEARALYLFPTKALAHDQLAETAALLERGRLPVEAHSYDGDTPAGRRRQIRQAAGILVTNPDMLHAGILPQHTAWRGLFANLRYVVLDEIHAYRGVFGSHVANVLRRLARICHFYGSRPAFICCSATIANPAEHAGRLLEADFELVAEADNGAPAGRKQFILYNPPLVDAGLGLRRSAVMAAKEVAAGFLRHDVQTVVFARARQTVELLLAYLRDELTAENGPGPAVAGYRGGYLPLERRAIEAGLREGALRGVVATNALELGIDIGRLGAAVLTGYPGSVASTWQQAGRAGRREAESAVVLVAAANPLDQYLCQHPGYLFGRSPEHALCNPDNPRILAGHLACAAYELPFRAGEHFGRLGPVEPILEELAAAGRLHQAADQYHWLGEGAPAHEISLRTSGGETVVIQDTSGATPSVIGELDLESVHLLAYEGAIYLHQARSFLVESLDWDGRLASVRPVEVDYYTRSSVASQIRQLRPAAEAWGDGLLRAHGGVLVVTQATGYRKIRRYTHETLGYGPIELPEIELDTEGYWLAFGEPLAERLYAAGILARPNEYGP
ncbi:MAG: DEAD/DEAH box helicase, partial [Candidatus Promineifilaceae bacterium]